MTPEDVWRLAVQKGGHLNGCAAIALDEYSFGLCDCAFPALLAAWESERAALAEAEAALEAQAHLSPDCCLLCDTPVTAASAMWRPLEGLDIPVTIALCVACATAPHEVLRAAWDALSEEP